ncbi:MAG: CHRD domain-containing protein [Planctomycetota bacterium]
MGTRLVRVILGIAVLAFPVRLGAAAGIKFSYTDSTEKLTYAVVGGPIDADVPHVRTFGTFWPTSLTISEDAGAIYDDLLFQQTTLHAIPPHGEGVGSAIFIDEDLSAYGQSAGPHSFSMAMGIQHHGSHYDIYSLAAAINVANGWLYDITGWTAKFVAYHSCDYSFPFYLSLNGRSEVPPTPSQAFGTATMLADRTGYFHCGITVANLAPSQIVAARIHLGAAGQNGPPIADVGYAWQWQDVEGTGATLDAEGYFPTAYERELLTGRTYLSIETGQFPLGEVRSQIRLAMLMETRESKTRSIWH